MGLFIGWVIGLVIDIHDDSDGNNRQGYLWLAGLMVVVGGAVVLRIRGRRRRQRLAQEPVERRARLGLSRQVLTARPSSWERPARAPASAQGRQPRRLAVMPFKVGPGA